ncbi:hypothetical protein [Ascidiimonas aurantiaca]|uniref:hypothetical protein n=1 Tax=Ascidiimonas aurantiaca TaxID=1685432 RepID=UPI0030EB6BCB
MKIIQPITKCFISFVALPKTQFVMVRIWGLIKKLTITVFPQQNQIGNYYFGVLEIKELSN